MYLKSNFLLCRLVLLSDHNFISNEGNLIISFVIERYCWVEYNYYKKSQKSEEEQGWKMEVKICNFLSTLFQNKDFILKESPILADVENIIFKDLR